MDIHDYMEQCRAMVNYALNEKLPPETDTPNHLHEAMRYAVLNGGKRLRSAFIFAVGDVLGANQRILSDVSAAIEMIHAFSLIHDDLPALDNDDLRRGKPTCHKVFGEATAILAGDVLQSLAFETISKIDAVNPARVLDMIHVLAVSIGSHGMIGGEELDIEMVDQSVDVKDVEAMYKLKTGCLISASVVLAALAADCQDSAVLSHLGKFGEDIGMAFQIHDDIIGIESDTAVLGKKKNADLELNKPIHPFLAGIEQSRKRRDELFDMALQHLRDAHCFNDTLHQLSAFAIQRNY